MINSFTGKHRFLSNFWSCSRKDSEALSPRVYGYPSVEHAYQAAKTKDLRIRRKIRVCRTPGEAKRIGRTVSLRKDWDEIRLNVMDVLVRRKFENPALKEKLLGRVRRDDNPSRHAPTTGDEVLVEGNHWHDTYWGVCNCPRCGNQGQNQPREVSKG